MSLEPIEEADLDLKKKFIEDFDSKKSAEGVEEKAEEKVSAVVVPNKSEEIPSRESVVEKDNTYANIVSKSQSIIVTAPVKTEEIETDAEIASQEQGIEAKVNNLVNIAMQKGVAHAVKVAKHLDDNYMLDSFHDKLMTDELHEALLQKGLIEKA
jgi:hypothetical protein